MEIRTAQKDALIAAFECPYCRQSYTTDLASESPSCAGCGSSPSYEAILAAIPPTDYFRLNHGHFEHKLPEMLPGSASVIEPPNKRYGQGGPLTCVACDRLAIDDTGVCHYHGAGASYRGEPITFRNRDEIQKETGEEVNTFNIKRHTTEGLQNWR